MRNIYSSMLIMLCMVAARASGLKGEDCGTTTVIPSLPFADTSSTATAVNDYIDNCAFGSGSGPDVVYAYTCCQRDCHISCAAEIPTLTPDYWCMVLPSQEPTGLCMNTEDDCANPNTPFSLLPLYPLLQE